MKDYLPFSAKDFQTGVIITGLGKSAPYALQFKKGYLVDSIFLAYEMDDTSKIADAIIVAQNCLTIGKSKIYYDSLNLVNPAKTIIKKELVLIK